MAEPHLGGNPDSTWVARSDLRLLVKAMLGEETWLATDEDLTIHETDTTNVHGIADTSKLLILESTVAGGDLTGTYPNPTIGNAKVTEAKLANGSVTELKLAGNSVGPTKLKENSVETSAIVNSAVTNAKIGLLAVATTNLQEESVAASRIKNEAVQSAKLANFAVTNTKYGEESLENFAIKAGTIEKEKLTAAAKQSFLNQAAQTLASAATLTVSREATLVNITGVTGITKINATVAGHLIVLKFAEALTVTDGENLKLRENFVTTADDTLTLICNGTNWYEVGRSAN